MERRGYVKKFTFIKTKEVKKLKRKIFSVLFALVLVLSFSLIPATPAAAGNPTAVLTNIAGGIDTITGAPTGSGTEAGAHDIVITDATASTLDGADAEHSTNDTLASTLDGNETLLMTIAGEAIETAPLEAAVAGTALLTDVRDDIQTKINNATSVADVTVSIAGSSNDKYFVITVDLDGVSNSITGVVTGTNGGEIETGLAGAVTLVAGADAYAVDTLTQAAGSNTLWYTDSSYGDGSTSKTFTHTTTAGTASDFAGLETLITAPDAFILGVTLVSSSGLSADTPIVTVTAGTASYLAVTGATGTPTAGADNQLTVIAYDDVANRDLAYASSQTLTFSGPSPAPDGTVPTVEGTDIGTSQSVTFSSGVANGSNLTLIAYKAETTTVDVSDGTINSDADDAYDLDLVVSPKTIDHFVLVTEHSGIEVAGVAFSITLTAEDEYDNTATGYNSGTESITFTKTATNAPDGTTPTVNNEIIDFSATPGIATSTGFILVNAGETPTITGTDGSSNAGTTAAITVNPAAFAEYTVVPANTSQVAGTAFTVTTTAVDQFQNTSPTGITDGTLDGYTFTFSGPANAPDSTTPTYPTIPSFSSGVWAATNGVTLVKAEGVLLTVTDNQSSPMSGVSASITVAHGVHAAYTVVPAAATQTVGTSFNVDVTAVDASENIIDDDDGTLNGYAFTFTGPSIAPDGTTKPTAAAVDIGSTVASGSMPTFSSGVSIVPVTLVRGEVVGLTVSDDATVFTGISASIEVFKVLVLNDGWTLISTDREIDTVLSAWVGTTPSPIFKYTGVSYVSATLDDLQPVDALYVKTVGGGEVKITSSTMAGVSSKSLVAGWNLISSATGATNNAPAVLSPLHYIDVGEEQGVGLATLVSQGNYNLSSASWYIDATTWTNLGSKTLNAFDGYWVYMNAAKSFGVVSD